MKRWAVAVAMFSMWSVAALWAEPDALTSLSAVHRLTNAEAAQGRIAVFEATITYFRPYEKTMFVQDGDEAIYVQATTDEKLVSGDRILVRGTTHDSFRPFVLSSDIKLLHHGAPPKPQAATFEDMIGARLDCVRITTHAVVLAADSTVSSDVRSTTLQLRTNDGDIEAVIDSDEESALKGLLDAAVEVTGAVSGRFDGKMQMTGVEIHVTSLADVKIVSRPNSSPWLLPITPMGEILSGYKVKNQTPRIHVRGTITYYQPGSAVVLQNGSKSLWIATQAHSNIEVGDVADATGFPAVHDGFLTLARGELEPLHERAPVSPQVVTWHDLTLSHNIFDLISIEGKVVTEVREAGQDVYVLMAGGNMFSAIVRHPAQTGAAKVDPPPMKQIATGSMVRVTGICILEDSNPFNAQVPFDILMRSSDDITVTADPPLLTERNLVRLVNTLFVMMLIVFAWGWSMRRKAFHQTAALARQAAIEAAGERYNAELQRRRGRILEDINGARSLTEILEEITRLVSFQLKGPPCWLEMSDGARVGTYPANAKHLHIASEEIRSRSGPALGMMFAGFYVQIEPGSDERQIILVSSQLATLAIETRRLYTDLVHRSEFDLLTDIHNRFSLEKQLDALIGGGREKDRCFGIVYVDLDEFKQVNDIYGHHVGDLYLQDVSMRMKRQLRTGDMLERLGGDEFAVLMPTVCGRADVEEIAQRLERCLDTSFAVEGYVLQGAASVGVALYPEDGTSRDSILSAADAAMYVAKHLKQQAREEHASRMRREIQDHRST
jgi:diguanylate cyclase (GGDEF)-like protein